MSSMPLAFQAPPSEPATSQGNGQPISSMMNKLAVTNLNGLGPITEIDTSQCGVCDPSFRDNVLALMGFMYSTSYIRFVLGAAAGPLAVGVLSVDTSGYVNAGRDLPIFRQGVTDSLVIQGAPAGSALANADYDTTNVPTAGFPGEGEAFAAIGAAATFGQLVAVAAQVAGVPVLPGGAVAGDAVNTPSMQQYRLDLIDAVRASYSMYISWDAQQNNNKVYQLAGLRHYPTPSGSPSGDNSVPYTGSVIYFTRYFVAAAVPSTTVRLRVFLHARAIPNKIMENSGGSSLRAELEALGTAAILVPVELLFVGILYCAQQVCQTPAADPRVDQLQAQLSQMAAVMKQLVAAQTAPR